ncbi:MAG TPA: molybdenum cofactor biosynthesis protein MoaE [Kiritimatiellia bacterium]|mgnify:CR=1 FL=1|nr:molybdenum cofactor biosynthesis protein MoaE [Kiritimatiellia bacterium]
MFNLADHPIDSEQLRNEFSAHTAGALVVFEGIVRDFSHGKKVVRLEYEATPALANAEYELIVQEVARQYPLIWTRCVHRIGVVDPGGIAIWLGVATAHRAEAFDACRQMIDQIKARVPIWKKEYYDDGESEWINSP